MVIAPAHDKRLKLLEIIISGKGTGNGNGKGSGSANTKLSGPAAWKSREKSEEKRGQEPCERGEA